MKQNFLPSSFVMNFGSHPIYRVSEKLPYLYPYKGKNNHIFCRGTVIFPQCDVPEFVRTRCTSELSKVSEEKIVFPKRSMYAIDEGIEVTDRSSVHSVLKK